MKHVAVALLTTGLLGGLALVAPAAQRDKDADGVRTFVTSARLVVDATGQVAGVEPDPKLAPVLQQVIRTSAKGWRFEPPTRGGKAVEGSTHATIRGCAAAIDGELRMQVALLGTGPGMADKTPAYPNPSQVTSMLQDGDKARVKLTYRVEPSGAATLEHVEQIEGRPALLRPMRQMSTRWMASQRFIPEQLDGQPVATRMTTEIAIALGDSMIDDENRKALAERQRDCATALKNAPSRDATPVALDSPFLPRPGSS